MALDGTYAGLKASIADFLNRADLTASIPDFITMAEGQINRRFIKEGGVRQMVGRSDASISTEFAALPTDFVGQRSIYMTESNTRHLKYCLPEQINEKKDATTDHTGNPEFYSIVGGEFQFFPAPTSALTCEITYAKRIPALSVGNPSNWLLTLYPDAYLYTALINSAPYLKDDARIDVWAGLASAVIDDIIAASKAEGDAPYLAVPDVPGGTP